ncbi:hypothetical protein BCL90_1296 [Pedobacter alluvionis]|uniref:Uncharacterized protein n=1 Tax=Pedobacter alluvionis TaxID=475253 RepID=A0A497YBE3_9SPHI|nr:hypothetical protein BCL90_1296 [Pedobacter alluvionis]
MLFYVVLNHNLLLQVLYVNKDWFWQRYSAIDYSGDKGLSYFRR